MSYHDLKNKMHRHTCAHTHTYGGRDKTHILGWQSTRWGVKEFPTFGALLKVS